MPVYLGDFDPGTNIYGAFSTVANGNSVGTALVGGNLVIYKPSVSNANFVDGVSLTANFASLPGQNVYNVNTAANATLFAAGGFFVAALNNGNVGSTSVAGYIVSTFTLRADSALKPATAGRNVVIDAGGCAAANVVNFSCSAVNANIIGNISGNLSGSVNTVNQTVNANVLNSVTVNANVVSWLGVAPQQLGAANGIVINGINGGNITANIVGNMTGSVNSVNQNVNANSGGGIFSVNVTQWLGVAPNALASGRVDALVGAMNTGVIASGTIASAELNNIADALLDRANGIETGVTPRLALRYTASAVAGNLTGGNTTTTVIAGVGVATTRITAATPDANGNTRTVTLS